MRYVPFVCKCCKGVWRLRVEYPRALDGAYAIRTTGWCRRCGRGDCPRSVNGECNERRRDAS